MRVVHPIVWTTVVGFAVTVSVFAQRGNAPGAIGAVPGAQRSVAPAHVPRAPQPTTITPNLGGQPFVFRKDIPTPLGLNAPAAAYTGIAPGALKPVNPGRPGRGTPFFPGFVGAPLFFPPYIDAGVSTFPGYNDAVPPPQFDPNAQAVAESQDALAQQIQNLSHEIQSMKSSQQQPPTQPLAPAMDRTVTEHRPTAPPITLVLKNGQQLTVDSYAIMNQTFWNFSKYPAQKIPVSSIDINASSKVTEANGGEFPQINSAH